MITDNRQCTCNVTSRGVRITISRAFVALIIQRAKGMCFVVVPSVACPAVPYFFTLSLSGKKFLRIKCVMIFYATFFLKRFSFQDEFSEMLSQMCTGLHVKYLLLLPDFNAT